ncbi:hypothetical protein [Methylobacterium sp. WL7]|uniref:hypothetical protein n=1 Tax=Methylobacterium sp. WL7 TaxID=2603900 RepID=UPI00164F9694|nr:hypothetical protein [Methylobacterium sp. WL7]
MDERHGNSLMKDTLRPRAEPPSDGLSCILDVPFAGPDRFASFGAIAGLRPVGAA